MCDNPAEISELAAGLQTYCLACGHCEPDPEQTLPSFCKPQALPKQLRFPLALGLGPTLGTAPAFASLGEFFCHKVWQGMHAIVAEMAELEPLKSPTMGVLSSL